jgi:hypothetical protein
VLEVRAADPDSAGGRRSVGGTDGRPGGQAAIDTRRNSMLETIIVILVVLWLLGLVTSYTLGGFIHILLVIAIVVVLLRVIQGRGP